MWVGTGMAMAREEAATLKLSVTGVLGSNPDAGVKPEILLDGDHTAEPLTHFKDLHGV